MTTFVHFSKNEECYCCLNSKDLEYKENYNVYKLDDDQPVLNAENDLKIIATPPLSSVGFNNPSFTIAELNHVD